MNIQVHNPVKVAMSVQEALSRLTLNNDMLDYITTKREEWQVFGKMNSHLYRKILMKRMQDANLNGECQFMVFFLFGVIKNQNRIVKALDAMEPPDQARAWYGPTKTFIQTHITQYVSDVVRSKKFPGVNVPNCNPGLDVLVYCLITHPNERSYYELTTRPTFSQLNLSADVQQDGQAGYAEYWNTIVTGTKNPDKAAQNLEEPRYRAEYYANVSGDKYKLINLSLEEIDPADDKVGYTLREIYDYMVSIDFKNEFVKDQSKLWKELEKELVPTPTPAETRPETPTGASGA
jgi:hypothetical protein